MSSLTFASHSHSHPHPHPTPAAATTGLRSRQQQQQQQQQESDEQPIMVLERRFVYGRGFVEVRASRDETGVLLIEECAGDLTRILAIITAEGQDRLRDLLAQTERA